ncbi:hypothetical protein ACFWR4_20600, partial [Streptomyces hydrogenans]
PVSFAPRAPRGRQSEAPLPAAPAPHAADVPAPAAAPEAAPAVAARPAGRPEAWPSWWERLLRLLRLR